MQIYRVTVTRSAYVRATSKKAAEEFANLIAKTEVDHDVEVVEVTTNELGWFPHSLIYTEDGSDVTVAEAFNAA